MARFKRCLISVFAQFFALFLAHTQLLLDFCLVVARHIEIELELFRVVRMLIAVLLTFCALLQQ